MFLAITQNVINTGCLLLIAIIKDSKVPPVSIQQRFFKFKVAHIHTICLFVHGRMADKGIKTFRDRFILAVANKNKLIHSKQVVRWVNVCSYYSKNTYRK